MIYCYRTGESATSSTTGSPASLAISITDDPSSTGQLSGDEVEEIVIVPNDNKLSSDNQTSNTSFVSWKPKRSDSLTGEFFI